jgi:hypothetical protein
MNQAQEASMFGSPKNTASRPQLLGIALAAAAVVVAVGAVPASAGTPVHIKRAFGPVAGDAPAGTLCDFAYHEEDTGTQNLTRFTDEAGDLARVEDQVDVTILHRNSDTGMTLIEHLHYAAYVDLVNGTATVTGQTWRLVDQDGRLVLGGAGLVETDLITGEVTTQTPQAKAGSASPLCAALGGAPAS